MRRSTALLIAAAAVFTACDSGTEPEPVLAITSISPALLEPGVTMVIEGTGFSSVPSDNEVTLAGGPLEVAAATSTSLTIELDAGSLPCGLSGDAEIVVSVDAASASTRHPAAGADGTPRALEAGELIRLSADDACTELTEPGQYLISVFNATNSPTASSAFRLRGVTLDGGTAAAPATAVSAAGADPYRSLTVPGAPARLGPRPEELAHLRTLERNTSLVERLGMPSGRTGVSRTMAAAVAAAAPPALGSIRTFRIPDIDETNACTNYMEVDARVVYAGTHGVIYEDTAATVAGAMADEWDQLGREFDEVMYPVLLENFGDPLVLDDQLDANDRLFMLFSEAVNDFEREIAGFVYSGDFYSRDQCRSSDSAEIFYGIMPTSTGSGFDSDTPDRWLWSIRSTVIHEAKHITSFAARIAANAGGFEDTWLEESTARIAEELYAREIFGYQQAGNTGYEESLFCEVRPGSSSCQGMIYPFVMTKHFDAISAYFESMETLSPIGPAVENDWTYYGSGWLLVRWAIDQSALTEAEFLKALISETGSSGMGNISERTGRSFRDLIADFSLAAALDDRPGVTLPAGLSFPSWDTRDIFAGLQSDFPDDFDATPLDRRQLPTGSFDVTVPTLRGGSASIFELDVGSLASRTLQLQGEEGGAAPGALGLAIVRIQ